MGGIECNKYNFIAQKISWLYNRALIEDTLLGC